LTLKVAILTAEAGDWSRPTALDELRRAARDTLPQDGSVPAVKGHPAFKGGHVDPPFEGLALAI